MEWQPIETAPKDGRYIFIFLPTSLRDTAFPVNPRKAQWQTELDEWSVDGLLSSTAPQPTHWMPLPKPPKGE